MTFTFKCIVSCTEDRIAWKNLRLLSCIKIYYFLFYILFRLFKILMKQKIWRMVKEVQELGTTMQTSSNNGDNSRLLCSKDIYCGHLFQRPLWHLCMHISVNNRYDCIFEIWIHLTEQTLCTYWLGLIVHSIYELVQYNLCCIGVAVSSSGLSNLTHRFSLFCLYSNS